LTLAALSLVTPVADAAMLDVNSKTGGFQTYVTNDPPGFISWSRVIAVPGRPYGGRFGVEFAESYIVESMTLSQAVFYNAYGSEAALVKDLDVYANGKFVGTITLETSSWAAGTTNPFTQTVSFADSLRDRSGNLVTTPIEATWITCVIQSLQPYTGRYMAPEDWHPRGLSFDGVSGQQSAPMNLHGGLSSDRVTVTSGGVSTVGGIADRLVDGDLLSVDPSPNITPRPAENWVNFGGAGENSVLVNYDGSKNVTSVGIALDGHYRDNSAPKWVVISGGVGDEVVGEYRVELDPEQIQYNRYDGGYAIINGQLGEFASFADVLKDVEWLKLTFPSTDNANDWYGGAGCGLVEFQAFGTSGVGGLPEPLTMSLLTLGGLAMLRRRT